LNDSPQHATHFKGKAQKKKGLKAQVFMLCSILVGFGLQSRDKSVAAGFHSPSQRGLLGFYNNIIFPSTTSAKINQVQLNCCQRTQKDAAKLRKKKEKTHAA